MDLKSRPDHPLIFTPAPSTPTQEAMNCTQFPQYVSVQDFDENLSQLVGPTYPSHNLNFNVVCPTEFMAGSKIYFIDGPKCSIHFTLPSLKETPFVATSHDDIVCQTLNQAISSNFIIHMYAKLAESVGGAGNFEIVNFGGIKTLKPLSGQKTIQVVISTVSYMVSYNVPPQ